MTEHILSRREMVQQMIAVAAAPFVVGCGVDRLLSPGPSFSSAASSAGPVTLLGAGDPHAMRANYAHQIGRTMQAMLDANPNASAFALGDLVNNGTVQEYREYYEPAWGGFKDRTFFAMGNHDRKADPHATAYYDYLGDRAGPRGKGYYAMTLGAWRCYFLNSEILHAEQGAWLARDLPNWRRHHIMAMWHTPLFASVCAHSGRAMTWPGKLGPWWKLLQDHGAEFVVSGHVHRWERYPRMLRDGKASAAGLRQFIVGTGGITPMDILTPHPRSQRRLVTRGISRFELHSDRYTWKFTDLKGVVRDSGTQFCRKAL
jgi:acid phosphatase type 7